MTCLWFHLPHHIHHPKNNRVASLPETLHGSNAHVKNRNVLAFFKHTNEKKYCRCNQGIASLLLMESAWHLDPQRFHIPPSPSPALRKGVILLKAIHHGLNQPINQFPFPTFWLRTFCVCWTPGQVMPGIHAIFPFFFPSRVTSHRDFFESNQTLLRLSQLSKVNTIDKVRTLQEHCPQRLPLNNPKPSPPSHDPLPRGESRRRRTWALHSISGAQLSTWHYLKFYPNKTWIINGGSHFLVRKYMEKSSPMASPLDQDSEDHHNPRGCRHHWNCQTSPFQETEVGGSSTTKKKNASFWQTTWHTHPS